MGLVEALTSIETSRFASRKNELAEADDLDNYEFWEETNEQDELEQDDSADTIFEE